MVRLYACDPDKNSECDKQICFRNGGGCYQTVKEEFARGMIKIKLDEGAKLPVRAHPTDAGLDLFSRDEVTIWGGKDYTFDTGVHIELPEGFYGKIESKSGLNVNQGIVSCGGVIDEGYIGSIKVKLYNLSDRSYHFVVGDKIAQLIIQPYFAEIGFQVVESLEETDRGENGFGSTGR